MSWIDVYDTLTPYLRQVGGKVGDIAWKSIRRTGFWLRGQIKQDILAGGPPGEPYQPREDIGQSIMGDRSNLLGFIGSYRGRKRKKHGGWRAIRWKKPSKNILGKLVNAVYVEQRPERMVADIGWMSNMAHRTGVKHEYGFEYPVTPKMRRFFWAMGIPLSASKTRIKIPVRATYGPEYRIRSDEVAERAGNYMAEWIVSGRRPPR